METYFKEKYGVVDYYNNLFSFIMGVNRNLSHKEVWKFAENFNLKVS